MKNASDYIYYLVHFSKQLEKQKFNHINSMGWYNGTYKSFAFRRIRPGFLSSFVTQRPLKETGSCLR